MLFLLSRLVAALPALEVDAAGHSLHLLFKLTSYRIHLFSSSSLRPRFPHRTAKTTAVSVIFESWAASLEREADVRVAIEGLEGLEWALTRLPHGCIPAECCRRLLNFVALVMDKKVCICLCVCVECLSIADAAGAIFIGVRGRGRG